MFNWGLIPVNGCVYYGFSAETQVLFQKKRNVLIRLIIY